MVRFILAAAVATIPMASAVTAAPQECNRPSGAAAQVEWDLFLEQDQQVVAKKMLKTGEIVRFPATYTDRSVTWSEPHGVGGRTSHELHLATGQITSVISQQSMGPEHCGIA